MCFCRIQMLLLLSLFHFVMDALLGGKVCLKTDMMPSVQPKPWYCRVTSQIYLLISFQYCGSTAYQQHYLEPKAIVRMKCKPGTFKQKNQQREGPIPYLTENKFMLQACNLSLVVMLNTSQIFLSLELLMHRDKKNRILLEALASILLLNEIHCFKGFLLPIISGSSLVYFE